MKPGDCSATRADFNGTLLKSINETIAGVLGEKVLESFYIYLEKNHTMVPEEVPYRLDSFFDILEHVFGVPSAHTLGRAIGKTFYSKICLEFSSNDGYRLQDYVEQAKRELLRPDRQTTQT